MKKKKDGCISLKWGLSVTVVACWVLPILIIVLIAGYLLNFNYEGHVRHVVESVTTRAMEQVEFRVDSALEASKAVSYDGDVREAYRDYLETGNQVQLYSDVTNYLSRSFSREQNFKAVFITFLDQPETNYSYVVAKGKNSYGILQNYREKAEKDLLALAGNEDTGIWFWRIDGELYMVRNLLDTKFKPYAVLVMLCNEDEMFQSLAAISSLVTAQISVDGTIVPLTKNSTDTQWSRDDHQVMTEYTTSVNGHTLIFKAQTVEKNLWGAMPGLRWAVVLVVLLVFPLLLAAILIFYRHVTHPVEVLVEASNRVQAGERGYQITQMPKTQEFSKLTRHFNSMSTELESQFERLYLEQQSLQEAKIKALQSQINPHFLGNTLEIINWEARLAEDDKVSAMIEALATMLDAAIGRDGRSQIALREELTYVDAYLYIIQQRMGPGLKVSKEIDETLMEQIIPRLLVQPLVENAVEHDISRGHGSYLCIRVYKKDKNMYLEVEHEGEISAKDQENLDRILNTPVDNLPAQGKVGLRNLHQRIKLIYGEKGNLTIHQVPDGQILARVELPFDAKCIEKQEVTKDGQ